jgi:hypothetical protein
MAAEIEEMEAPGPSNPDGATPTQRKNTVEENRRLRRDYRNFAKRAEGVGPLGTCFSIFEIRLVMSPSLCTRTLMTRLPVMAVQRTQTGSWTYGQASSQRRSPTSMPCTPGVGPLPPLPV